MDAKQTDLQKKLDELKLAKDLTSFEGLSLDLLVKLGEKGVKTLDDFADLASDELVEIAGDELTEAQAGALILKAREHWFDKG